MNDKTSKDRSLIPVERIERSILLIRGQKVMLDRDLAHLYGVATKVLNQAVKRHKDRFPEDFMFQLTMEEAKIWWTEVRGGSLRSQIVTLKRGQHIKYRPYAFTKHGILMLSSVLSSERAVQVNIQIMRTFVRLRRIIASHADLARKLDELEKRYDAQFKVVFEAIRELMKPPETKKRPIGFLVEEAKVPYLTKMKRRS
jgi:phage regulator Rha-like protein